MIRAIAIGMVSIYAFDKVDRQLRYNEAYNISRDLGKPLLVIGGPHGSCFYKLIGFPAHGFGDVCYDISMEACKGAPRIVIGDIRTMPFTDNEFGVAYCSHVLEQLPTHEDCEVAIAEMQRVADRVIIASRTRLWIGNWMDSQLRRWIDQDENGEIYIQER